MARQDYQVNKDDVRYSDIFINLNINPGNNQLARHTDEAAVRRSIKNLVMTDKYERLHQPTIRCDIKSLLFEPMGPIVGDSIKTLIEETIRNHEKRANLIDVLVRPDYVNQIYTVTIIFSMINIPEPVQMNLMLKRVR